MNDLDDILELTRTNTNTGMSSKLKEGLVKKIVSIKDKYCQGADYQPCGAFILLGYDKEKHAHLHYDINDNDNLVEEGEKHHIDSKYGQFLLEYAMLYTEGCTLIDRDGNIVATGQRLEVRSRELADELGIGEPGKSLGNRCDYIRPVGTKHGDGTMFTALPETENVLAFMLREMEKHPELTVAEAGQIRVSPIPNEVKYMDNSLYQTL